MLVIILKSIGIGAVTVIVGRWIGLVPMMVAGMIIEPIIAKSLDEWSLRKFRHIHSYVWQGLTIGISNGLLIYFMDLSGWTLLIVFIASVIFFLGDRTEFVLYDICDGDEEKFRKLSSVTQYTTFVSYLIGVYGISYLLTI